MLINNLELIIQIYEKIVLNCDYVQCHLRYGHFELELDDKNYKEFKALPKEKQLEQIKSDGDLIIDSYRIDDYETEGDFKVIE